MKTIATAADQRAKEYEAKRGQFRLPKLTRELAYECAKLLMSGVPLRKTLGYCDPDYAAHLDADPDEGTREISWAKWEQAWMRDPLLLAENSKLSGGEWQDLDKDKRLEISLDKHFAELAYFLYSHSYEHLKGADIDKADAARQALMDWLANKGVDTEAPWMKAIKDLMAGVVDGKPLTQASDEVTSKLRKAPTES